MSYRANGETGNKLATTLKTIVTVVATAGSNNNSLKSFKKYSFYKVFLLKYRLVRWKTERSFDSQLSGMCAPKIIKIE